ncbi:MAG: radical SAM protein [Deltaproteobacteria bacterium]|nr:radical SAM protein [Deltaproteobacteria bacterium]MBW2422492.1 radical SAM protein [Deltaproteobacteria bacterium]
MLPVSDLLEVARNPDSGADVRARAPRRFGGSGEQAPVVIWNVCMHCNMACPHCYAAAVSQPSPTDLTPAEGLDLIDQMAACGVQVVIFSGGEPLLRPDLFELMSRARDAGIAPQLSTNGVLIDGEMAQRIAAAGVEYVGVSIDGLEGFNDAYRGLTGGFHAALNGLRHAKAAGLRTGLRMTLTRLNVDEIDAMLDIAADVAADRFYVSHLVYSGRGFQVADDDLSRAQARAALEHLFERAEALLVAGRGPRIVTGSNDSDGPFLLRWIERRLGAGAAQPVRRLLAERGGNSAGERILNIDSRGRVHPDQFWRQAVLGDLRKASFATILEHPMRKELRDRLERLSGRCGVCNERALCRGSHRERALARYRDPWASDPACVMEDEEIGTIDVAAAALEGETA